MIFPLFLLSCFLRTARTGKSQSSLLAVSIEIQYLLKVTATKEGSTWYVFLITTRSMTCPCTRTLWGFISRFTSKIFPRWSLLPTPAQCWLSPAAGVRPRFLHHAGRVLQREVGGPQTGVRHVQQPDHCQARHQAGAQAAQEGQIQHDRRQREHPA